VNVPKPIEQRSEGSGKGDDVIKMSLLAQWPLVTYLTRLGCGPTHTLQRYSECKIRVRNKYRIPLTVYPRRDSGASQIVL
jgi:hypothetical protein